MDHVWPADLLADPALAPVAWSISILDADTGSELVAHSPDLVRRTASIGKLLLLTELAAQLHDGTVRPETPWERKAVDHVGDSGIWQHLQIEALPVADIAALVAATSDNLATNVLLRNIGLPAVTARGHSLGLHNTALHDQVRNHRLPADPPTLSTGTGTELAGFFARVHRRELVSPAVSEQLLSWLSTNTDLSMTAAGWGLDPLAHQLPDRKVQLWNKTGTDTGIRCDTGLVVQPAGAVAYAVLANWPVDGQDLVRDRVLSVMREIGSRLRSTSK